jgi:general secretion pathway protein F
MPVYNYAGVAANGKKTKGVFDAESPRALRDALRAQGIFVTEYVEGAKKGAAKAKRKGEIEIKLPGQKGFNLQDIAVLTRQLATLQKAGIPLVECLSALVEQSEKPALQAIVSEVRQKVSEGSSLAGAMSDHPEAFNDLYINMIRAGESSGNLDVVLLRLTEFLDDSQALRQKVTGALVYPILMIVLGGFIVAFLMTFVVPKVTQIFEDQDAALPLITTVLITLSHIIGTYWYLLLAALGGAIYGFRKWVGTSEGRAKWDAFVLKTPIFGPVARMIAVSRFSKTLSTLLGSGVPLLNAMGIVQNILGNSVLIAVVEKARLNIREGESIAGPLSRSGEFPPMMTHMIAVGERTGSLEDMLENVSEAYDAEVSTRIQALTTLLEPLMIVVMGGAVAFIVVAILLPILQLNESFA